MSTTKALPSTTEREARLVIAVRNFFANCHMSGPSSHIKELSLALSAYDNGEKDGN